MSYSIRVQQQLHSRGDQGPSFCDIRMTSDQTVTAMFGSGELG